jgi:hypothetical protein
VVAEVAEVKIFQPCGPGGPTRNSIFSYWNE